MNHEQQRERQRLLTNPFVPLEAGISHTLKLEHAAEFTAFYLGEIVTRLDRIAVSLETLAAKPPGA